MSHFSQVKTNVTNKKILKQALEKMGFKLVEEEGGVDVRGYFGETSKAEFKALTATHYDIGFVKAADGSYEIVADWELMPRVAGITQDDFTNKVKREYAKETIYETAKAQGYEVACVEQEDGQMELVVTQW